MTIILPLALAVLQSTSPWTAAPPLPAPVTNNAVAGVMTARPAVFSFLGLDPSKRWDGIGSVAYRWTVGDDAWHAIAPVPGPGRLAATAEAVGGRIYLFGGYTVAEDGSEKSLPDVDIYDAETGRWSRGADIPLPVDDAVSGVWRDSLIYLVSGWHDTDNAARVQVYDPAADRWADATPIPGPPVFGHAGALAGDHIVYLGGVATHDDAPRFRIEDSAWIGRIDPTSPTRIEWQRLPDPPGPPLYRAAAGAAGPYVLFAGGTDNPYNFNGIGYDGEPADPLDAAFAYDTEAGRWLALPPLPTPSMDHRGIVVLDGHAHVIGGMAAGQRVTDGSVVAPVDALLP